MKCCLVRLVSAGIFLSTFATVNTQGDTIYVDDDGPTDFESIQEAIDNSGDGDTIVVEKGVYLENIHFKGKNIILTGTNPKDPAVIASTIIDGDQLDSVVTFDGTENSQCLLSGFTIRNGNGHDAGGICGGTESDHTKASIVGNTIIRNVGWDCGGITFCDGLIENNLIANNTSYYWISGGGLYECDGIIRNNIIVANYSVGCDSAGALSFCDALIENCTIAYNIGAFVIAHGWEPQPVEHNIIRNCIIWGNSPNVWGNSPYWDELPTTSFTYIDVDPLFVWPGYWESAGNPEENIPGIFVLGDYHLKSQAGRFDPAAKEWVYDEVTSTCIDAGDPISPLGAEPFPSGGIINMGAYGATPEASKSYFGKTPCKTIIAADINGDCNVNMTDLSILVLHWLEDRNP